LSLWALNTMDGVKTIGHLLAPPFEPAGIF
jgi:hypothetical protein